jgi:isoleucyl-tRNA synthetase
MYSDNSELKTTTHKSENILDRWIVARLAQTLGQMTQFLDRYEIDRGVRPIGELIDDLSTWYLRRSRDRFKSDNEQERTEAITTTRYVLLEISKLIAPVMPFYAEELYQKVKDPNGKESVHLEKWPEVQMPVGDLIDTMNEVREIVEKSLAVRNEMNIKVRQPLGKLTLIGYEVSPELMSIIKDEVNVKEIVLEVGEEKKIVLDSTLNPDLIAEGKMRDLVRAVQDKRKTLNWNTADKGELHVGKDAQKFLPQFENEFKKISGMAAINYAEKEGLEFEIIKL